MSRLLFTFFNTKQTILKSRQGQVGKLAKIIGQVVAGKLLAQTYTCTGNINFNINLQVSSCSCIYFGLYLGVLYFFYFYFLIYLNLFVFDIWYPVH